MPRDNRYPWQRRPPESPVGQSGPHTTSRAASACAWYREKPGRTPAWWRRGSKRRRSAPVQRHRCLGEGRTHPVSQQGVEPPDSPSPEVEAIWTIAQAEIGRRRRTDWCKTRVGWNDLCGGFAVWSGESDGSITKKRTVRRREALQPGDACEESELDDRDSYLGAAMHDRSGVRGTEIRGSQRT